MDQAVALAGNFFDNTPNRPHTHWQVSGLGAGESRLGHSTCQHVKELKLAVGLEGNF